MIGITYLYVSTTLQKEDLFIKIMDNVEKWFNDSKSVFITFIVIILFYILLLLIGVPMSRELKPITIRIIESKLWIIFLLCIINEGIKFLFNIDSAEICINQLYRLWNYLHPNQKEIQKPISAPLISETKSSIIENDNENNNENNNENENEIKNNEVFNISNNLYTYQDAQAVCKSFDARLATYDEVENSYKKGGEWCNYGWSDSQMILFPTQKATWNKLQKSSTDKNNCGRPGVNGGYLENSSQKFGINCYGKKPDAKEINNTHNNNNNNKAIKTKDDIILDAKVKFWRENADKMITVNSFNSNQWNEN